MLELDYLYNNTSFWLLLSTYEITYYLSTLSKRVSSLITLSFSHPKPTKGLDALSTSHPYKYLFVGAVQSRIAPTVRFPAKKFKFTIQNHVAERSMTNVLNCVRVAERPATSVCVAERPVTNVPNHVRVAECPMNPTTSTRVLYKLQLQVQFIRIYTIHH
jgi:hypothetical protein